MTETDPNIEMLENVRDDASARAQDRISATRLLAEMKYGLRGSAKGAGGAGVVHVHLCADCPALKRAEERVGEAITIEEQSEREDPYRWGPGIPD